MNKLDETMKWLGEVAVRCNQIRRDIPIQDYETTVGDDIAICVKGEYSAPDKSTGYNGGFVVGKVWLAGDVNAVDISSLLNGRQIVLLEEEAFYYMLNTI